MRGRIYRLLMALIVLGASLSILTTGQVGAKVIDGVFININGKAVTFSEFRSFVATKLGVSIGDADSYLREEKSREKIKALVNTFINVMLVRFELMGTGASVKEEEIDAVVGRIIRGNNLTESEFGEALAREGMTLEGYRENLREEIEKSRIIKSLRGSEVTITEEELKKFYLANGDRFRRHYKVDLEIISLGLPVEEEKDKLIRFRETLSIADSLVEDGGGVREVGMLLEDRGVSFEKTDTGPISIDDLSEELRREIRALSTGDTSASAIVGEQVLFVKILERVGGEAVPFEEVKDVLREELAGKRSLSAIKEIIKELRENAYVEVHL